MTVVVDVLSWLTENPKHGWGADTVPGADDAELGQLFALGGFANPLVYPGHRQQISDWPEEVVAWTATPPPPAELCRSLRAATQEAPDVLAQIYEGVVRASHRRRLGTFFTPPALVRHMLETAERCFQGHPRVVVDPGAGVGAFTISAAKGWEAEVIAVDINPVTLGLLGMASALQGLPVRAWTGSATAPRRRVHLLHTDYVAWIGSFLQTKRTHGALVLGNPPYTRHQSLSAEAKRAAYSGAGDLVTSSLAGLSTYFLAATLRHMQAEDGLVFLLPSNWLATRYACEVRTHIWTLTNRRIELHVFPSELQVFAGTQVAAAILSIGPRTTQGSPFILAQAHLAGANVELTDTLEVDRGEAEPTDFTRLGDARPSAKAQAQRARRSVALGDVAVVRRGVASGANARFFLTDDEAKEYPTGAISPALLRARTFDEAVLTREVHADLGADGHRRWLLDFHDYRAVDRDDLPKSLRSFTDQLEAEGIHQRHLLAIRGARWWVPEYVSPAEILLAPMTKQTFRVIRNEIGAIHSNTLYGITTRDGQQASVIRLAAWLLSGVGQRELTRVARRHATGLLKLEPRALTTVRVPRSVLLAG